VLDDLKRLTFKALQALARERSGRGFRRLRAKEELLEALRGKERGKDDERKAEGAEGEPGRSEGASAAQDSRHHRTREVPSSAAPPTRGTAVKGAPSAPAREASAAAVPRVEAAPSEAPGRSPRRGAAAPAVPFPATEASAGGQVGPRGVVAGTGPGVDVHTAGPPATPASGPEAGPGPEQTVHTMLPDEGSLRTPRTTPSPASASTETQEPRPATAPEHAAPVERDSPSISPSGPRAAAGGPDEPPAPSTTPPGAAGPVRAPTVHEGFFRPGGGGRMPTSAPAPELRAFARDPWSLFALWTVHPHHRPGRYRSGVEAQPQLVLLDREGTRLAAQDVLLSGGHYFGGLTPGEVYAVELWWRADGEVPEPLPIPPREVRLPPSRPAPPREVQLLRLPWGTPLAEATAQLRGERAEPSSPFPGESPPAPLSRPGTGGPQVPFPPLPGSGSLAGLPSSDRPGRRVAPASSRWPPSSAELSMAARLPGSAEVRPSPWLPSSASLPGAPARVPSSADVRASTVSVRRAPALPPQPAPGALPGSAEAGRDGLSSGEVTPPHAWHPLPGSGDVPRAGAGAPGVGTAGTWEAPGGPSSHGVFPGGPSSAGVAVPAPRMWVTWVVTPGAPLPPGAPGPAAPAAPAFAPPTTVPPTAVPSTAVSPTAVPPAASTSPAAPPGPSGGWPRPPGLVSGGETEAPPPVGWAAPREGAPLPEPVSTDFFGRWRLGLPMRRPGPEGGSGGSSGQE
jgi:hypothetical protein